MPSIVPAVLLGAVVLAGPGAGAPCSDELFRIERNKNANVIVYELRRGPDGKIDPQAPVRASWIMLAEKGQREDLNWLERTLAYGFDVKPATPRPGWILTLKAKDQPIHVTEVGGCTVGTGTVAGRQGAVLKRIYVKAEDGKLIPSVEYVDVFGVDPATGAPLRERITPEPQQEERPEWKGG